MYWYIRDLWGPTNIVALTVIELDNTLPRFMDVFVPPKDAHRGIRWKMALE
jgi:hypothetical protein